ncbi:MAG TPA: sugar phosphate isomerase/epimerase family protein [Actinomycetota bacterium]|jgi:sugar phosphate isomerase/epimerase|nr:sugar phosphate isomerase/epimerase family protein [Actinomycetota bacterium]
MSLGDGLKKISLQCSLGTFWAYEIEEAMDAAAQAGFKEVELMVTRDPATQEPDLPLRLARERGLRIASVHGPFLFVTKSVWGFDPIEKIKRGTEMCRALGAETLIVHPPFLWENDYAHWIAKQAELHEQETGIRIAVETMYPKWVAGRPLAAYRWIDPEDLSRHAPSTALDTSHLTVAREDVVGAYRVMKDGVAHIHLSNNAGDGRDGHLELSTGVVPIDDLLDELRRTGYSGSLSLELSVTRYLSRAEDLVDMLSRNRRHVEERLRGAATCDDVLDRQAPRARR